MAADVLDPNPAINSALLQFREQLREAYDSGKYANWAGTVDFRPRELYEFESGTKFKKRLTNANRPR